MGPKCFLSLPDGRKVNVMWIEMINKRKDGEYNLHMMSRQVIIAKLNAEALKIISSMIINSDVL